MFMFSGNFTTSAGSCHTNVYLFRLRFSLLLVLMSGTCLAQANNIVWVNTGGGNWSDHSNWRPRGVPGTSDTAIITNAGHYTVVLDVNSTVAGLTLGTTNLSSKLVLSISNRTLNVSGKSIIGSSGQMNLNGAVFNGHTNNGGAVFNGGLMCAGSTLSGIMTIASNAVVNFVGASSGSPVIFDALLLTNHGTVNWTNDLQCANSVQIVNYGLWTAWDNNMFHGSGTTFENFGTFRKGGDPIYSYISSLDANTTFNNTGTVDIQNGALFLDHGFDNGTLNVSANTIFYSKAETLTGSPTFTGAGSLEGTFTGNNALLQGLMSFSSATLTGTLSIASNAVVNLVGYGFPTTFDTLVLYNYGTVNWTNDLQCANSVQIVNYGLWTAWGNNMFHGSGTSFDNFGTFRKSGDLVYSGITSLDANTTFNNAGMVDIQNGALFFDHGSDNGMINVSANTAIYSKAETLIGNPTFTGNGSLEGTFTGNNAVLQGLMSFDYATLTGTLAIASNAVVNFNGVEGLPMIFDTLVLTNYGTVNWSNTDLQSANTVQIANYGLWDAQSDNALDGTTFDNFGTFRKSGSTSFSGTVFHAAFNNYGLLDIQSGLVFGNGFDSGTINTVLGSALFSNPLVLTGQPDFDGSGALSGTFIGSNAVLNGQIRFGLLTAFAGTMTFASNAVVNLQSFVMPPILDTLVLTNYGTVNWGGTDIQCTNPVLIANYGLWDAQSDQTFGGSSNATFNNFGTFRKSGGISSSGTVFDTAFNNHGLLDIQSGKLNANGSDSGTINIAASSSFFSNPLILIGYPDFNVSGYLAGTFRGSNAVLNGQMTFSYLTAFTGTLTFASNAVVNLQALALPVIFDALVLTNQGTINWVSTDIQCTNVLGTNPVQVANYGLWDARTNNTFYGGGAGTLFDNFGTLRKSGGTVSSGTTSLDHNTTLNNQGTVDVQNGSLAIGGNYTLTGGRLNFGINGLNNSGTISLAGNAALVGTLSANLNNGYSPAISNSFPLLAYGSETGTFSALDLPHLTAGLMWQANYGSMVFSLSVTTAPPLQLTSAIGQGGTNFSFSWSGAPGQSYQVQCATNLAPANWQNLGRLINGTNGTITFSDVVGLNPQRFYRVVVQ